MKKLDWVLLALLFLLLLVSFPVLWRVYRFLIPAAAFCFIVYFAFRFLQLGKNTNFPSEGFSGNFTKIFAGFITAVRRSFRMIAVVIISCVILFVVIILFYNQYSKKDLTEKQMAKMTEYLSKYKTQHGKYPEDLAALIGNDPLKREWFHDSWGNELYYKASKDGLSYRLSSSGADGKKESSDDLILEK